MTTPWEDYKAKHGIVPRRPPIAIQQIAMAQIDPNGLCNSKCWFCPVAYQANPEMARKNMPVEVLEDILKQLADGRGDFVTSTFDFIYTAHYNEVLLYKHFEEMLQLFRKYGFKTIVLTNGTPLTPERTDIIKNYLDVVYGICFNVPSSHPEEWSRLVGMNPKLFDKLVSNIAYAIQELPEMHASKAMSIQVNGMNELSLAEYGGWLSALPNAPELDLTPETGSLSQEVAGFRALFPDMQVYEMPHLIDRAGYLDKANVITNIKGIERYLKNGKTRVVGCGNGIEVGGRTNGWLHVNANGDTFICCNDYDFDTVFGNVNEASLRDIWLSDRRQQMIQSSYEGFCTTCASAIWE